MFCFQHDNDTHISEVARHGDAMNIYIVESLHVWTMLCPYGARYTESTIRALGDLLW
jgi:hypothetical protein